MDDEQLKQAVDSEIETRLEGGAYEEVQQGQHRVRSTSLKDLYEIGRKTRQRRNSRSRLIRPMGD